MIVPEQPNGWDCLYQVMHMLYCTNQFLKNNPYGFTDEVAADLDNFSEDNFSYDASDAGTTLRKSLCYLANCFLYIQQSRNRSSSNDDEDSNNNRGNILSLEDIETLKKRPIAILDDYNNNDDDVANVDDWKPVAPIQLTKKQLVELKPVKKE